MSIRLYRSALIASLIVNAVLIGAIALYVHYAGLLDLVESVIGIIN